MWGCTEKNAPVIGCVKYRFVKIKDFQGEVKEDSGVLQF